MAEEETPSNALAKLVNAASVGNLEDVKRLVSNEIVDQSWDSTTALVAACRWGHIDIIRFLLDFGADVSVKCNDSTPLHVACDEGHPGMVRLLIDHGANIEAVDWYHRTPLHRASDTVHAEVVVTLLEAGADVNSVDDEGWTPLHTSRTGPVTRALLGFGADVNALDSQGYTPLARLSICEDKERICVLLDYGAGVGIPCPPEHTKLDADCAKTVLMCAYAACHQELFREWLPCFEKYFVKSRLAGLRVETGKPAMVSTEPLSPGGWTQSESDAYAEKCLHELRCMQTDTIGETRATFFSLLKRQLYNLRGQRILGIVEWEDCRRKYPIYGDMIRCSYQNLFRFFLTDRCTEFFSLVHDRMLSECAEMVLGYLSNKDLENLVSVIEDCVNHSQR